VIAPFNCVVLAATLKRLFTPVKLTALPSVIAALVLSSAVLPDELLLKLMEPLVLVRLEIPVKSSMAVFVPDGAMLILPPPTGPNAPTDAAINLPLLIVLVPV